MTDPAAARTEMVPWHVAKRTFDVVFAIGILTLALPLLAIIVVLIQLDSHGVGPRPVLESGTTSCR